MWAIILPYIGLIGIALLVPAFRRLITPKVLPELEKSLLDL
jgi:hypothetical protein